MGGRFICLSRTKNHNLLHVIFVHIDYIFVFLFVRDLGYVRHRRALDLAVYAMGVVFGIDVTTHSA